MLHRTKSLFCLFVVVFSAALALNAAPARALQDARQDVPPRVVGEIPGNPVSYCHMKFPAIDERSLGNERPMLKDDGPGGVIDFYGPCNHDPLGTEEIQKQKRERQMEDSREGE